MRNETIALYTFDELSDDAKDVARAWYRSNSDYCFGDDAMASINAFCDTFGVCIKDYSLSTWRHSYIETNAENHHFRGLKLKSINRDAMPTGYCLDNDLWFSFYDEFKRTGDALYAFNEAIDAAKRAIVSDMEYQESDSYIDEMMQINEYEFTESGKIYW